MVEFQVQVFERQRKPRGFQVRLYAAAAHGQLAGVPGQVQALVRLGQQGQQVLEVPAAAALAHLQHRLLEDHAGETDAVAQQRAQLRAYHRLFGAEELALGEIRQPRDAGVAQHYAFEGGIGDAGEPHLPAQFPAADLLHDVGGELPVFEIGKAGGAGGGEQEEGEQNARAGKRHV